MATEILLTRDDIELIISTGVSAYDSSCGTTYYNLPDWFVVEKGKKYARRLSPSDLPKWVKEFAQTPEETYKDQQIKDLQELLVLADNLIMYSDTPPMATENYKKYKQSYQQKYPKP